jgi:hypothetical protein
MGVEQRSSDSHSGVDDDGGEAPVLRRWNVAFGCYLSQVICQGMNLSMHGLKDSVGYAGRE